MIKSSKRILVRQGLKTFYFSSFKSLFRAFDTRQINRDRPFDCIIEAYRTESTEDIQVILYKEVCQTLQEIKFFYNHLRY